MAKTLRATESLCPCCREVKSKGQFYPSVGIQFQERVPICRDCCKAKFDKYSAILGEDAGAWVLFGELGIPYIADKWRTAKISAKTNTTKGKGTLDPITLYVKSIKDGEVVYQGFWDSDVMYNDIVSQKTKASTIKNDVSDLPAMQKKWGTYENIQDYEFLEETLMDYTENLTSIDANLLNRYKDLCVAELAKRKAQESGDIGDISKAQDNVAKQLKLLKIDDFKQESTDEREKFIDRLCWMIEETEPAEEEDRKKYRDIAGFEEAFSQMMRSMRNLLTGSREYPDIPKEER